MKKIRMLLISLFLLSVFTVSVQAATKLNLSVSGVKKALNNRTATIQIDGDNQIFIVKKGEISKAAIKKISYSNSNKTAKAKVVIYVNRKVATVRVPYTLTYKTSNKKWKLAEVKQEKATITKINIKGTWKGTIDGTVNGKKVTRNATVKVTSVTEDGYIQGDYHVIPKPIDPDAGELECTIDGGYDLDTGLISFRQLKIIKVVPNVTWNLKTLYCKVDLENKAIINRKNEVSIFLKKS